MAWQEAATQKLIEAAPSNSHPSQPEIMHDARRGEREGEKVDSPQELSGPGVMEAPTLHCAGAPG